MTTTPEPMMDLGRQLVEVSGLPVDWANRWWNDGDSIQRHDMVVVPSIAIPPVADPARAAWDERYLAAVERWLGARVAPLRVPVDPALTEHNNPVRNRWRYDMYQRMCAAADRLPPIVVRPCGRGVDGRDRYFVMDGNHRWFAAQSKGVTWLDAVMVEGGSVGEGWTAE